MLETILDWLLPPTCPGCGRGGWRDFCGACRRRLPPLPPLEAAGVPLRAAGTWDGPMRHAVAAMKFQGVLSLADPVARLMARAAAGVRVDAVVEVPPDAARLRRRGYHVPALLAGRVAVLLGVPHRPLLRTDGVLPTQRGLGREERLENLAGVFLASRCDGLALLLVDDVVTTGATLREASAALRRAGAVRVEGLAAAVSEMLTPSPWQEAAGGASMVGTSP